MKRISLLFLLAGCARAASPAPAVAPQGAPGTGTAGTAADAAAVRTAPGTSRRCAELADSTSRVGTLALPRASNASPGRLDAYPRDIRDRAVVRATYRIRPDGSGEARSLVISGSTDPDFRRALERAIEQMRARPAQREGCPVWSRAEYMIKAEVRMRTSG